MMNPIRITKEFSFEAAHALRGYDGPCRGIHGHSYKLSVTVSGIPVSDPASPKDGMVMDFSDLKQLVKTHITDPLDHALILPAGMEQEMSLPGDGFAKLCLVDYQPTSENMLLDFARRIRALLPPGVTLTALKLRETDTSHAEWVAL
jgi:6-pyruvoyltetrahydropterin/6-carboxytetrahydropterin synthase